MPKFRYVAVAAVAAAVLGFIYFRHGSARQDDRQAPKGFSKPLTLAYVEGGSGTQALDFYKNKESGDKAPVLLWVHGGYWVVGSRYPVPESVFDIAREGGWDVASAGYRYATDETAPWPEIVFDVKYAVKALKVNAEELGTDPGRIIVIGGSAGGHLAGLVATSAGVSEMDGPEYEGVPTDVAAAVLIAGVYNMDTFIERKMKLVEEGRCGMPDYQTPVNDLLDCPIVNDASYNIDGCAEEDIRRADPATYLDPGDPPVFLVHGSNDCVIPYTQSEELADSIERAGVPVRLVIVPGGVHSIESLKPSPEEIVEFVRENAGPWL